MAAQDAGRWLLELRAESHGLVDQASLVPMLEDGADLLDFRAQPPPARTAWRERDVARRSPRP